MIEPAAPHLTPGARRILEAASELFYGRGIHSVGVDTIAAESGVTKRTLYDRFGSKDALVTAYLQQRHAIWWDRLEQRLATADAPRVLAVFDAYSQDAPTVERGCAFLNAAGELPTEHAAYAIVRAHKRAVRERLTALVAEDLPDLTEPAKLAEHVFLLLEGAITQSGIDEGGHLLADARELARDLLDRDQSG